MPIHNASLVRLRPDEKDPNHPFGSMTMAVPGDGHLDLFGLLRRATRPATDNDCVVMRAAAAIGEVGYVRRIILAGPDLRDNHRRRVVVKRGVGIRDLISPRCAHGREVPRQAELLRVSLGTGTTARPVAPTHPPLHGVDRRKNCRRTRGSSRHRRRWSISRHPDA